MFEKCDRGRVRGFLHARGTSIVNGEGQEVLLTGWGLGNWLLPEGYMWLAGEGSRFDRPRRIEQVICELTSQSYAASFWKRYRERYITEYDIRSMAKQGYNSVRIPIDWRVLMEDRPGICFIEEGFQVLDRVIGLCEQYGLYVFLDLHAAPGGQTGSNIDDSVDDLPRLLTDRQSWYKAVELWKAMARRYRDRWIVGGYDLLNEPVKPGLAQGRALNAYLPRLVAFYEQCIAEIRKIDPDHMISLEGSHWATDLSIFFKRYDDNMMIHFHRYACMPGVEAFAPYLEASRRLGVPLWLGESGENVAPWFAAMFPLSVSLNIGYNLWPWKKMDCANSPYSITPPEDWDELIAYTHGGSQPCAQRAEEILEAYLERVPSERCVENAGLSRAVFRRPGYVIRGTDFDELPGRGVSYSGIRECGNLYYRSNTAMAIELLPDSDDASRFAFDSGWDRLTLRLKETEFATYYIDGRSTDFFVTLRAFVKADAELLISWRDKTCPVSMASCDQECEHTLRCAGGCGRLKVQVISGTILLNTIAIRAETETPPV